MDVKTMCLGVLSRGPASGYEIRKFCEEGPFAHFFDAGFGSIYPALRRLSEQGLVQGDAFPQESRPDKIVYRLTEPGHAALCQALSAPPAPDRIRSDFTFILYFAHLVPPALLDRVVADRIDWYRRQIERLTGIEVEAKRTNNRTGGALFTIGLGLTVYRAAAAFLETHRAELTAIAARPYRATE